MNGKAKVKAYYENNRKRLQEKTRNGNGSLLKKEKRQKQELWKNCYKKTPE